MCIIALLLRSCHTNLLKCIFVLVKHYKCKIKFITFNGICVEIGKDIFQRQSSYTTQSYFEWYVRPIKLLLSKCLLFAIEGEWYKQVQKWNNGVPSLTVIGHNKITIFCSKLQIHVSHLHTNNNCNKNSDPL